MHLQGKVISGWSKEKDSQQQNSLWQRPFPSSECFCFGVGWQPHYRETFPGSFLILSYLWSDFFCITPILPDGSWWKSPISSYGTMTVKFQYNLSKWGWHRPRPKVKTTATMAALLLFCHCGNQQEDLGQHEYQNIICMMTSFMNIHQLPRNWGSHEVLSPTMAGQSFWEYW